jgi:hypothetical protein
MSKPETDRDLDIEAWAENITDTLRHVPPNKRTEVLALAVKNEEAAEAQRKASVHPVIRERVKYQSVSSTPSTRNKAQP